MAKRLRYLSLSLLVLVGAANPAPAPPAGSTKLAEGECQTERIAQIIETKITQATETEKQLSALLGGEPVEDNNLKAIFTLEDVGSVEGDQVTTRITELRATLDSPETFVEFFNECPTLEKKFKDAWATLTDRKAAVTRLRIEFLLLPVNQRQTLLSIARSSARAEELTDKASAAVAEALLVARRALKERRQAERIKNDPSRPKDVAIANEWAKIATMQAVLSQHVVETTGRYRQLLGELKNDADRLSSFARILTVDQPSGIKKPAPPNGKGANGPGAKGPAAKGAPGIAKGNAGGQEPAGDKTTAEAAAQTAADGTQGETPKPIPPNAAGAYPELVKTWRGLVEQGLNPEVLTGWETDTTIPPLLPEPRGLTADLYEKYKLSHETLVKTSAQIRESIPRYRQELVRTYINALRTASALRSQYITTLDDGDMLYDDYLGDVAREVRIIPTYVWALLFSRWVEIKKSLDGGLDELLNVVRSLAVLAFLLLLPFLAFIGIKRFTGWVEQYRREQVALRTRGATRVRLLIFLQFINPYLSYLLALLVIEWAGSMLTGTFLAELEALLPYFKIFIIYKLIYVLVENSLSRTITTGTKSAHLDKKVQRTMHTVGRFFLFMFWMLYATSSLAGEAFFYRIVSSVMYISGFMVLAVASYTWRDEIGAAIAYRFQTPLGQKISEASQGYIGILLALPLFFVLLGLALYRIVARRLFEFDFARKALAQLTRRQIEAAGGEAQSTDIETLPADYLEHFTFGAPQTSEVWINPATVDLDFCKQCVRGWLQDQEEESTLAIFGEKGIGKSTLLGGLVREFKDYNIIEKKVPPKLTKPEDVVAFFANTLGTELTKPSLLSWDKNAEKTILLLDDAHNFFLATIGGFEGYRTFLKMINQQLDNLFVCATFNIHSWLFLDSVFGRNRYFRDVIQLSPWKEADIRNLILTRHKQTGYRLHYDQAIARTGIYLDEGGIDSTERRFFRLLWEESDGNPRSALYAWLSSLSFRSRSIRVGIPLEREGEVFKDLQSNTLFVYAALVKHENLSKSEATRVTDMPEGVVAYALKVGLEREFIERTPGGRYRLNPGWHGAVVAFLRERNLLYAA